MLRDLISPLGVLWLLLAPGCVQVKVRVKAEAFDFAGGRATTRDFPAGAICEAEPRFLLDEFSSVNGLLARFLDRSEGAPFSEEAIALVDEAGTRLPPLLELHGRNVEGASRCEFAAHGAWPSLLARARTLVHETRTRLEDAPPQIRAHRKAQALEVWRRDRLAQQESARRACPPRPGAALIYFAWREGTLTTWLFCDGAQLTRDGQQRPSLEAAPEELTRGRRPSEAAYLGAAGRFPAGAVMSPPGEEGVSVW